MNKCLLSKWIIKLERSDTDLCTKMLRNKHLKEKVFLALILEWGHNSRRGCMKLNTHVGVGLNM
jgi:hypothetical protein